MQISSIVAMLLGMCLTGCGGGGGGSSSATTPTSPSSPGSPYQGSQQVANGTFPFNFVIGGDFDAYILSFQSALTAKDDFWVSINLPLNATATTSSQELVQYSLWVGSAPPVPAVAGTPLAWQQFSVSPAAITLTAGYSLGLAAAYYVYANDPLGVPVGRYVECSLYAGSQLIGSGSNVLISTMPPGGPEATGGPGAFCTPANHGSDSLGRNLSSYFVSAGNDVHDRLVFAQLVVSAVFSQPAPDG